MDNKTQLMTNLRVVRDLAIDQAHNYKQETKDALLDVIDVTTKDIERIINEYCSRIDSNLNTVGRQPNHLSD